MLGQDISTPLSERAAAEVLVRKELEEGWGRGATDKGGAQQKEMTPGGSSAKCRQKPGRQAEEKNDGILDSIPLRQRIYFSNLGFVMRLED